MKKVLELVLCVLHPVAVVPIWIKLAMRRDLGLIALGRGVASIVPLVPFAYVLTGNDFIQEIVAHAQPVCRADLGGELSLATWLTPSVRGDRGSTRRTPATARRAILVSGQTDLSVDAQERTVALEATGRRAWRRLRAARFANNHVRKRVRPSLLPSDGRGLPSRRSGVS